MKAAREGQNDGGAEAADSTSDHLLGTRRFGRRWRARAMRKLNNLSRPFAGSDSPVDADTPAHDDSPGEGGEESAHVGRSRSWLVLRHGEQAADQACRLSRESQPKLVVKHTFLELTLRGDVPPEELELAVLSEQRQRAYTDTAIEYGSDTKEEMTEPSESEGCEALERKASKLSASTADRRWSDGTAPSSAQSTGDSGGDQDDLDLSPHEDVEEERRHAEFTFELSGWDGSFASTADGFEEGPWASIASKASFAPTADGFEEPHHLPSEASCPVAASLAQGPELMPPQPQALAEPVSRGPSTQQSLQTALNMRGGFAAPPPPGLQAPYPPAGVQSMCCFGPPGWLPWRPYLAQVAPEPQSPEFLNCLRAAELDVHAARLKVVALQLEEAARRARMQAAAEGAQPSSPSSSSPSSMQDATRGKDKDDRKEVEETFTTVMLRHLPAGYTRAIFLEMLDSEGFKGCYDFVYLPADFVKWQGFGYAFVNLHSNQEAVRVWKHFDGFNSWPDLSSAPSHQDDEGPPRPCEVSWGDPLQGLTAHVERYRNSPVMHKDVPEQFKPACFANGVQIKFPPPTKRIRPPRLKHGSPAGLAKPTHEQ